MQRELQLSFKGDAQADTGSDAPFKRTAVERQVNMQILYLFILLLILSLVSTIGSSIRTVSIMPSQRCLCHVTDRLQWLYSEQDWYLYMGVDSRGRVRQFVESELLVCRR